MHSLITQHGVKTSKTCSCCLIYKLVNCGEFLACPKCDTDVVERRKE